jgi:hypothetical protein
MEELSMERVYYTLDEAAEIFAAEKKNRRREVRKMIAKIFYLSLVLTTAVLAFIYCDAAVGVILFACFVGMVKGDIKIG